MAEFEMGMQRSHERECGEAFEHIRVSELEVVHDPRRVKMPRG